MDLEGLVAQVEERAPGDEPLARVAAARDLCFELTTLGDQVVDHFVAQARGQGCSWAQIGSVLGVSRQGAQQRYGGPLGPPWRRAAGRGPSGVARFGPDARRAVVEAQTAARTMGHDHVDTQHLLLGVLAAGPDAACATMLARCELDRPTVAAEIDELVGQGVGAPQGHIPFSPGAKRVLELSLREAQALGHRRIDTRHVILGLLREGTGVAARLLERHGVDRDRIVALVRESPAE